MKKKALFIVLLVSIVSGIAFSINVQASQHLKIINQDLGFFEKEWLIISLCITAVFLLVFFFKKFTQLRQENFESYTSLNELIIKIRTLGVLSLLLFPLVEYYEGVYLELYPTNWSPIIAILIVSIFSLTLSFKKNITFAFASLLPQVSYYAVYGLLLYKSLKAGMLPVMAIETACLILFSKLIFSKLRTLLYFLVFVLSINVILIYLLDVDNTNIDIYLSATIQAAIVSVALFLIEGSSNRKNAFGSKILESSNLFVFVADRKAQFVYANRYLENVTGLTQNEILKDGWWKYRGFDAETIPGIKKHIADNIKENRNNSYENSIVDVDGNTIYISWDTTVIEEKYLLAVGKDVTQTKLLQLEDEKRKEKIQRYGNVINNLSRLPYSEKNNLKELLEIISKSVTESLDIERAGIWNYEQDKLTSQTLYTRSTDTFELGRELKSKNFPIYFAAITEAKILNAPNAYNELEISEFTEDYFPANNIKSLLDAPIFINGQLVGVLCCEQTKEIKVWDNEDVNFVKAVSDFIALSFEASYRKELEREYRYILNNAVDIIYTTDALGNFNFINKTASNILGYDIADLKGKHFSSIIHPDYKKRTVLFYLKQFKQRIETSYFEFKIIAADGSEQWVGQNVKLVTEKGNSSKIKGFQAVVRDITKQKEAELALIESENNFRQINETIEDVFWLYDLIHKKYIYISASCERVLGMSQEDFYAGKSYGGSFVHEEDLQYFRKAETLLEKDESYEIEYRIRTKEGKIKWINEKSSAIRNEFGRLQRNSGVCSDITEKKKQEEQLKELSLVTKTVSNGVVITNSKGEIEWCNESILNLMEYSLEELIGHRPIHIFSGPETSGELKEKLNINKNERSSVEILQYTKKGIPKWLLVTNTPLLNDKGEVEKYIEIVTDVTEQKKLEREYRYILNNAGDIIYTTDAEGTVEFLNESISKILEYLPSDLTGKHFTHIIHPEDKRIISLFYLRQFTQKTESTYKEFRVLDKSGNVHWVGQNVKLVLGTISSEVKGFHAILRDITRQKKTELALAESENSFRQINETINDVFYLYNVENKKYEYVSPNAKDILGADPTYFYKVNNYIADYVMPKDQEMVLAAVKGANTGESFEIEYRITVNGETRWIKEKSFGIKNAQGQVIKTSGVCIDVTLKKMQEKMLLKINKELSVSSEDLAINNLLKEQLIYTTDFEEIARVSLNTLKIKIHGIARGSLFLVDETNKCFNVYYMDSKEVKKDKYNFSEIKAYPVLVKGDKFIESNVDLTNELSSSDIQRRKDDIVSYILLPINYSAELIGALALEFEAPFSLVKREMDILENFTSMLSVVVNKLNLQLELSDKSRDVTASLNYAKNIQQSIFPNISRHKESIKSFTGLYLPKDVVSGDFYLVESFDEYTIIALGDCTGHGVPGAFLTLLGTNLLQRIAVENKNTSPSQILELLDNQIFTTLNRNTESTIRDGMELGICVFNKKNKTLTFSGAGLFLVYYKDNQQLVIQGNKRSIGDENHTNIDFNETSIALNGTEKFYMFSDGYRDQLGGLEKRKRFSRARFLTLLDKIKNLPSFQQEYMLKREHLIYKGKHEQTDDISVIGFELKL